MRRARISVGQSLAVIAVIAIEFGVFRAPVAALVAGATVLTSLAAVVSGLRVGLAVGAVLGLALTPFFLGTSRIGSKAVPIPFFVTDAATGPPLAGARIRLMNPAESIVAEGRTAADGREDVWATFAASIEATAFGEKGTVSFYHWWLEISADGHDPLFVPLSDYAGRFRSWPLRFPRPRPMGLARAKPPGEVPLSGLAGDYVRGDATLGSTLKLSADGRYVLQMVHKGGRGGMGERSGTVELLRGRLAFTNADKGRTLPRELVPFRWGERLYLVDPGAWSAQLLGPEPRSGPFGPAFLRVGDWDRMAGSLPELPGVEPEAAGGAASRDR
jgi:hypothetical protein